MKIHLKSILTIKASIISIILLVLLIFPTQNIYSDEYNNYYREFISRNIYNKLLSAGEVEHSFTQKTELYLLPNIPSRKNMIEEYLSVLPDMGVEILKLYRVKKRINFSSKKSKLLIYNIVHSISTLKGVKYYSHTHKKIRTLFYDSYVIASPDNPTKIDDPISQKLKNYDKIYIFQDDSTFGKNIFSVEYTLNSSYSIIIKIENITTMKYLFIPLIPPHKMVTYMIVIPGSNSILFYGLSFSNFKNFLPVGKENVVSFYNRLIAMYNWFIAQMNKHEKEFNAY